MRSVWTLAFLGAAVAGCADHGSTPDSSPPLVVKEFSIALSPQSLLGLALNTPTSVEVTINRTGGQSGVTLSLASVPSTVTASLSSTSVSGEETGTQLSITLTGTTPPSDILVEAMGSVQHGEAGGVVTRMVTLTVSSM